MRCLRLGEKQSYPFRSARLCAENGGWAFHTREGSPAGPYRDPTEAKQALAVFLAHSVHTLPDHQRRLVAQSAGLRDNVHRLVEELMDFFRSLDEAGETAALAWANNRIAELRNDWGIDRRTERIDVIDYAMDQLAQNRNG